jgi:hypothetical protein
MVIDFALGARRPAAAGTLSNRDVEKNSRGRTDEAD